MTQNGKMNAQEVLAWVNKELSDQSLRKWHNEVSHDHKIVDLVYDLTENDGVLTAKCQRCDGSATNDLVPGKVRKDHRLCPECGFTVWMKEPAKKNDIKLIGRKYTEVYYARLYCFNFRRR
jgi:hypothetical protein